MFLALPVKEILSRSRHLTLTRGHALLRQAEHGGNECETRKTNILNCHTAIHAMHTRHRKDGPATAPILSNGPTCNSWRVPPYSAPVARGPVEEACGRRPWRS